MRPNPTACRLRSSLLHVERLQGKTMNDNKPPVKDVAAAPANGNGKRKRALLGVTGVTLLAALAYGAWWWTYQRHYESTDNAYVQGPIVQITPQVSGTVLAVFVDDTDAVKV